MLKFFVKSSDFQTALCCWRCFVLSKTCVAIFNFRSKYTEGVASNKKWCTYAVTMWPFQTVWTYAIPKWSRIMEAAWEQGQVYTYVPPSMHCISFAVRLSTKWESGQTLYYSASLVHPVGNQKVEGEILHKGLCYVVVDLLQDCFSLIPVRFCLSKEGHLRFSLSIHW